jgi:hypothetical protein
MSVFHHQNIASEDQGLAFDSCFAAVMHRMETSQKDKMK